MSDMSFEPNYSPQDFGQPKKSNTGRNMTLIGCGGVTAVILLCCCCCIAGTVLALRQPAFVVGAWGGALQQPDGYEFARYLVCDGSQAEALTNQLETQNASFTTFTTVGDGTGDIVDVTANATIDGESTVWEATFTVTDAGSFPFSNCIDRIEVTSGGE